MWFQWYLSLLPLLWFGLPYSHWIKVQNCNGISRQIGPSSIVKSVVIYEANFKPNSFLLVNVTEPCEQHVNPLWNLYGQLFHFGDFHFFVLRTAYDNGKSQFRCEVDVCMCTRSMQHAPRSMQHVLSSPIGLIHFPPSHNPQRDSFNPWTLLWPLLVVFPKVLKVLRYLISYQRRRWPENESLLTVARESSRHSALMGQDQRLIRFVQTNSACFSQRGEIWGQSQSCCLKWNWDVVCWSFYNLKTNCVVRLLLLLSLMRIHVDICCVTSRRLCHI